MKKSIVPLLLVGGLVSGCATKKYVGKEVGEVNKKVENLSGELEKTQDRVSTNEKRIDSVGQQATTAQSSADAAMTRAQSAEKEAKGHLIYTVTLSNDKVTFPFNKAELSDEAKAMIDETLGPYVSENRGVYFEIEGHTDSTGTPEVNQKIGYERAQAVRDYLYTKYNVALVRMSIISLGETQPVADNATKEGRAQNRRVVIKVLE